MATPFPERLETPRLLLSRTADADLPDLTAMHTDPRVMATLGRLRTADELEAMHRGCSPAGGGTASGGGWPGTAPTAGSSAGAACGVSTSGAGTKSRSATAWSRTLGA